MKKRIIITIIKKNKKIKKRIIKIKIKIILLIIIKLTKTKKIK
jgi:hypothetical protein